MKQLFRIVMGFCMLMMSSQPLVAQKPNLDSLWSVWNDNSQPDTNRLKAIDKIAFQGYLYSQPDSAFHFAQMEYDFAAAKGLKKFMSYAMNIQGISFRLRGDYPRALEYYQKCLVIREEMGDKRGIAGSLNNIGLVYYNQGQFLKALEYYQRSSVIYEELKDKTGVANAFNNIGIIYVNNKDKSKALEYFQKSLETWEEIGDQRGIAGCLTNIGNIYQDQGDFPKALETLQRGLNIYQETGDKKGIADCQINLGNTYKALGDHLQALEYLQKSLMNYEEIGDKNGIVNSLNGIGSLYGIQGDNQKAITECQKAWQLAKEIGSFEIQKDAAKCLYDAYKGLGNGNKALEYHEQMLALNDSLQTEETAMQLERMEFQKQMLADSLKKEEEKLKIQMAHEEVVRKESQKRNIAIVSGFVFLLIAGGLYNRVRYIRKSRADISREKDRSDNLLLNILPAEIAEELKAKGRAEARDFDLVSILFTDFKEFTQASQQLSAKELLQEINTCFEAFDAICDKYGIEKIKTIGDAYMAAGGLPVPTDDSVKNIVRAALEMQNFIAQRKAANKVSGKPAFEMRAGIHTGPVVAGIVGVKKFQYDIWGDTVNTASRMESAGEVGKVNISQSTYELIKDDPDFTFEERGKVEAKGKGPVEMWYVSVSGEQ
ncbi:MAG: adenylate/guanylate cyclase domain-containing protein [Bacteroidia bacterium]